MKIDRSVRLVHGSEEVFAEVKYAPDLIDDQHPALTGEHPNLLFKVKTYRSLGLVRGGEPWTTVFKPINDFLELCFTREDDYALYEFFVKARKALRAMGKEHEQAVNQIAHAFAELDYKVKLAQRIHDFVRRKRNDDTRRFPIPANLDDAGSRPHDTESLTFREEHYHLLNTMSLICKLMAPVWGDFINRVHNEVDDAIKEVFCARMISPVLESEPLAPIAAAGDGKLYRYHENGVKGYLKRKESSANSGGRRGYSPRLILAQRGFSDERVIARAFSVQLVKKFVNIDLYQEGCNIMTYVRANINESVGAQLAHLNRDSNTVARTDPTDLEGGETNTTFLESDSRVSTRTADVPDIIRLSAEFEIKNLLTRHKIDPELFRSCCRYYESSPFSISVLNQAILTSLFAQLMGGGQGFSYLYMRQVIPLVVVAQCILVARADYQLAHLLSAKTPQLPKDGPVSSSDHRTKQIATNCPEFKQLELLFNIPVEKKTIEAQITNIVSWVTGFDHRYNTAPGIMQLIGEEFERTAQDSIDYEEDIGAHLCRFLLSCHDRTTA